MRDACPASAPWRLIELPPLSGARQMALDHALLEAAAAMDFVPTLRFHRWSPPALSIGRFQSLDDVDMEACRAAGVEIVRRPTGGKSIFHLDEFTYSIVFPQGFPLPQSVVEAYRLICGGILHALGYIGIHAVVRPRASEDYRQAGGACFAASTQADLEYNGRKLCGSAQVRRGGALLQHGSILLEDHSDMLFDLLRFADEKERLQGLDDYGRRCMALSQTGKSYGWAPVAASFLRGFGEFFGVEIMQGRLSPCEKERWAVLAEDYASGLWLHNAESRALPR